MRSLELLPTEQNLLSTYKNDSIGRNHLLHRFIDLVDKIEDSCVIALDNQWGSGKTFFIKQAKLILDSANIYTKNIADETKSEIKNTWKNYHNNKELELQLHVTTYYDAWEHDDDEDPLLSLVYEMYKTVESNYSFTTSPNCLKFIGSIIDACSSIKVSTIIDTLQSGKDLLGTVKSNRGLREEIEAFFDELIIEKGDRLVVFIDELDRCKPSYAVKLLERIKHYFCNDRITFIISVNSIELQNTIKQFYGPSFDSCRYLDRFFDLRTSLPKPDLDKFYNYIGFQCRYDYYSTVTDSVIREFDFELREITRFIKLIKIAGSGPLEKGWSTGLYGNLGALVLSVVPIMIGVKMFNTQMYSDFIQGKSPDLYVTVMNKPNIEDWFAKELLSNNETYSNSTETCIRVKYTDKLLEVYNAIFNSSGTVNIGSIMVSEYAKKHIENAASLLSDFAQFD